MFAAILGSLVMGTLASKVGENIVGKRLGMSEKDRKLLGTVFGMAGGAYGGYAGQAGFGSTAGSAFTAPGGQSAGMAGASPKVGGNYGTAMNLFSQPTQYDAMASMTPGMYPGQFPSADLGYNAMAAETPGMFGYNGAYTPNYAAQSGAAMQNPEAAMMAARYNAGQQGYSGYQYMPAMGTEYAPIEASNNPYISQYVGNADAPADLFQMNSPIGGRYNFRPESQGYAVNPVYQGPVGLDTSAQTFALDSPSRTIGLAPSGTPLEVMDASAYEGIPEPRNFLTPGPDGQMYPKDSFTKNNLSMGDAYDIGGNPNIKLVPSTGGGYNINPEGINMDLINADSKPGGRLTIDSDRLVAANSSVSGPPQSVGSYIENGPIIDNSLNADPRSLYENLQVKIKSKFIPSAETPGPVDSVRRPILSDGIKAQAAYDAPVPLSDPQGTPLGLKDAEKAIQLEAEYGRTAEEIQATAQEKLQNARERLAEAGKKGDSRDIERENQNIASTIDEVRATMQKQMTEDPSKWQQFLDKIPKSVKEWATMTGVSLLDMWIKQSLFGQDYDDQIAEGGGGGGGVLRGSSPVVSPYSGGGSGGGGKGVLFSMGGSGQQGRGTHIMALQ